MLVLIRDVSVFDAARAEPERANVLLRDGQIEAVADGLEAEGAEVIEGRGGLLVPGLVNAHTHAHSNLTRGVSDRWTLEDLLTYSAAVYGYRTPEEQYLSAVLGAIEMVKSGCTSAYDLFMDLPTPTPEAVDAVVQAYVDVGMRVTLAPQLADGTFFASVPGLLDALPADDAAEVRAVKAPETDVLVELTRSMIERHHETHSGRVRVAACATIPGQCSDAFLERCAELVRHYEIGFHCHLAETKPQAVYARRRWGKTVVEKLDEVGLLGPSFTGAHAIWLTGRDIELLARSGSSVVHNPGSNLKAGSGIAPIPELLAAGANVALGTDGSINSDNQNMFEAMRLAALVHRVRYPYGQTNWVGSDEVWKMATTGGAVAMGLPSAIGKIAPGYRADVVLLRRSSVYLTPFTNAANLLAYAETGASVDTVFIEGRTVVSRGRLVTVSEEAILEKVAAVAAEVNERNEHRRKAASRIWPHVNRICRDLAREPYELHDGSPPSAGQG